MKTISIINNKGGVGKTTIVQNLGVSLAKKGYKVGLIDFDPQANLSSVFNIEPLSDLRSVLSEDKKITTESFSETYLKNLFILPNFKDVNVKMFGILPKFFDDKRILKDKLGEINFDFLIIDTPPNLELQTINSLAVTNYVLIPIKYDIFSFDGLMTVRDYIEQVKHHMNENLEVVGIIPTHVDERESINESIKEGVENIFGDKLLKSSIRINTKFKHAQIQKKDIYSITDLKSISDFEKLTKELLTKIN